MNKTANPVTYTQLSLNHNTHKACQGMYNAVRMSARVLK